MGKVPAKLRLDNRLEEDANKVQNLLDDAYLDIAPNLNRKPDMIIVDDKSPTTTDYQYDLGSFWLDRDLMGGVPKLWFMTVKNPTSATWEQII